MKPRTFKIWKKKHGHSNRTAGKVLGVDVRTIRRYASGESQIDNKIKLLTKYHDAYIEMGLDPIKLK